MAKLTGLRLERAQASKQFRDGRFHNTSCATAIPWTSVHFDSAPCLPFC